MKSILAALLVLGSTAALAGNFFDPDSDETIWECHSTRSHGGGPIAKVQFVSNKTWKMEVYWNPKMIESSNRYALTRFEGEPARELPAANPSDESMVIEFDLPADKKLVMSYDEQELQTVTLKDFSVPEYELSCQ